MAKKILTHYDYTTDPNSPMMHYIQGLEYIDSGDKDNALKEYEILKQMDKETSYDLQELADDLLRDINENFPIKQ